MEYLLKRAAESKVKVQIIYIDKNQNITQRTITIRSIDNFNIDCYCHTKQQRRIFKKANILSVSAIKKTVKEA